MVAEPVGDGRGADRITEDIGPQAYPHVRRYDGRPLLISPRDELEDELCAPLVYLQVSKLVQYQQRQMGIEAHPELQLPLVCGRARDPRQTLAADEVRQPAVPHGLHPEGDREMGLAHAGAPDEDHVLVPVHEPQRGQVLDLTCIVFSDTESRDFESEI